MTLEEMMDALSVWAEGDDMCSVQINSDGNIYLSLGLHDSEVMTLEQFTEWCQEQI